VHELEYNIKINYYKVMETTKPRILKWSLIIGIIIVLNLLFNYSISLFYKEPDYNAYFAQPQVVEPITNKEDCLKVGGQWYEPDTRYDQNNMPIAPVAVNVGTKQSPALGNCNADYTKQQEFNDAQKVYARNVFIVLVILGVASLIVGAFMVNEIVSLGLSWGGSLSLIIASMRYWSTADNIIKVLILVVALGALIWLAIKKFGKSLE
jgi:hypothetical protein